MHTPRDPKAMAKSLRQALAERKIDISHSDSLECVARQLGWRDWNTLAVQLERPTLRLPEDWTIGGTRIQDYDMGLDPATGCALIRYRDVLGTPGPDTPIGGFGSLMQNFLAENYLGKRLRLTAQLKAQEVTGIASLWMRVDAERGRTLAFDNMEGRGSGGPLTGTAGWQERSIVMDVPAAARSIHFGFFLRGGGSVWARRFLFSEVDASIQTTDSAFPRRTAPANLDFAAVA